MDARFLVPGTIKQGYLIKSPPLDKGTAVFKVLSTLDIYIYTLCATVLSMRDLEQLKRL